MAESSLQDRLRDHAKAFDGLLSLIPAKMYYGEDNTDQWNRKKQTKAEAAAARRGKLDPDSELNRNAKEVMDERAKNKRKLRELEEQDQEDDEVENYEAIDGVDAEKPGEGLKKKSASKKQKLVEEEDENPGNEEDQAVDSTSIIEPTESKPDLSKSEQKRLAKEEKKKPKGLAITKDQESQQLVMAEDNTAFLSTSKASKKGAQKGTKSKLSEPTGDESENKSGEKDEELSLVSNGIGKEEVEAGSSVPESAIQSPTFDASSLAAAATVASVSDAPAEPASAATSVSSLAPSSDKPKHIKIPADTSALRARLAAKIQALRAARKADGPDGKPIRTRQELIEMRRAKQAERKANKKELKNKARLEEARKREEALASNSPSVVMSPAAELDDITGNFAFGRVAFGDGSQLSRDLSYVLNSGKKKGPSDPKTALLKVQNEKKRIAELDEEKRKEITEKEVWLTARRRAEGERIRDDEAMLKKAVKRKEVAKKKSEKAWKERSTGVQLAQREKQKKREDNLRKRREEKVLGRAGKKKKGVKTKKKARPGFEGAIGVGRKGKK